MFSCHIHHRQKTCPLCMFYHTCSHDLSFLKHTMSQSIILYYHIPLSYYFFQHLGPIQFLYRLTFWSCIIRTPVICCLDGMQLKILSNLKRALIKIDMFSIITQRWQSNSLLLCTYLLFHCMLFYNPETLPAL